MLSSLLSSDSFLYPIYIAIKAAYVPSLWFDAQFEYKNGFEVILTCICIVAIKSTHIRAYAQWIWLALIVIILKPFGIGPPLFLFTLPLFVALALKARKLIISIILAFELLLCYGLTLYMYKVTDFTIVAMPIFILLAFCNRVRLAKILSACVALISTIWLLLLVSPQIYEKNGAQLLAKLPSMQPDIVWVKEPKKGERINFFLSENVNIKDKYFHYIWLIYDVDNVKESAIDRLIQEGGRVDDYMEILGYINAIFDFKGEIYGHYEFINFKELLIDNHFNYQNFKFFIQRLIASYEGQNIKNFINNLEKSIGTKLIRRRMG